MKRQPCCLELFKGNSPFLNHLVRSVETHPQQFAVFWNSSLCFDDVTDGSYVTNAVTTFLLIVQSLKTHRREFLGYFLHGMLTKLRTNVSSPSSLFFAMLSTGLPCNSFQSLKSSSFVASVPTKLLARWVLSFPFSVTRRAIEEFVSSQTVCTFTSKAQPSLADGNTNILSLLKLLQDIGIDLSCLSSDILDLVRTSNSDESAHLNILLQNLQTVCSSSAVGILHLLQSDGGENSTLKVRICKCDGQEIFEEEERELRSLMEDIN
eukprot:755497-Hanusia_phi.AAC.1